MVSKKQPPSEEWDYENVKVHEPKESSSVYSVRFRSSELRLLREAAREAGVSTGEFIRAAALDRAQPVTGVWRWTLLPQFRFTGSYTQNAGVTTVRLVREPSYSA